MPADRALRSVLIVSGSAKDCKNISDLISALYDTVVSLSSAGEARRLLVNHYFDIVIINTPLTDEFGNQLALDISDNTSMSVLLLVKSEVYEQTVWQVEPSGVYTVQKPTTKSIISQGIRLLTAANAKIRKLETKAFNLKEKMEEIRIVSRAKCILIEKRYMDEAGAHRYIEKSAMDTRSKRLDVAKKIIDEYQ